jgi:hypothetical protein
MKKLKFNFLTGMIASFLITIAFAFAVHAQDAKPRKSPAAAVMQRIGVDTDVTIDYSRPAVNGRKIWGDLVPYGMNPGNKYSKEKPYPWRAGANENTTIEFSKDVIIQGKKVPAGKYGLFMLPGEKEFGIMINKVNDAWGAYTYSADENVLEINVTPVSEEHVEWLEYGFDELSDNGATAYLRWAELKIPFKIQLTE